jgi:hypothetical protein
MTVQAAVVSSITESVNSIVINSYAEVSIAISTGAVITTVRVEKSETVS